MATAGALAVAVAGLAVASCGSGGGTSDLSSSQALRVLAAGNAAVRAGKYDTAASDYRQVLSSEPHNKYALYDTGLVDEEPAAPDWPATTT